MLYSDCYKKIRSGEEIKKGNGLGPWGRIGGESKVVCRVVRKRIKKEIG